MFSLFYLKLHQLRALMWKCLLVRRYHWISTTFELFGPLLLLTTVALFTVETTVGDHFNDGSLYDGPIKYNNPRFSVTFDPSVDFSDALVTFTVFYAPGSDLTRTLLHSLLSGNKVVAIPFSTESILEEEMHNAMQNGLSNRNLIGLYFGNMSTVNDSLSISIKLPVSPEMTIKVMSHAIPMKHNQAPMVEPVYSWFGVQYIEQYRRLVTVLAYLCRNYVRAKCVDSKWDCVDQPITRIDLNRMPYPRYPRARAGEVVNTYDLVALCVPLSYVLLVPIIVKRITDEREARELLRLNGLCDSIFWCSHFVNHFVVIVVHSVGFTVILFAFGSASILVFSSWFIFFLTFVLFGVQTIAFSMLVTTMANRPVVATVVITVFWSLTTIVSWYNLVQSIQQNQNVSDTNWLRVLLSLLPSCSAIWLISLIGSLESQGIGLQFFTINTETLHYSGLTTLHILLVMLASLAVYSFFIWYLDKVWPFHEWKITRSLIGLFKLDFWKTTNLNSKTIKIQTNDELNLDKFEPEPNNLKVCISLKSVTKSYGKLLAVNNLNLNIYEKQATVLLGHNGSGKTTTMGMITGLVKCTFGSIRINGFDVFSESQQARNSISLCPQENLYFNELTVDQHLRLFSMIKAEIDYENKVQTILEQLKLTDKRTALVNQLSGGQKRKLSLALALIGDARVLILDEPTSAMDSDSRRLVWDLLLRLRQSRTILLTTHSMDEADIIGNRIVILSNGTLNCCGSSLFLKRMLGTDFRLRVAKQLNRRCVSNFSSVQILSILKRYFEFVSLEFEIESEAVFCLNTGQLDKKSAMKFLPTIMQELESNQQLLGIDSLQLSCSTLEDLFLKIDSCRIESFNKDSEELLKNFQQSITLFKEIYQGYQLVLIQLMTLILKRIYLTLRGWKMFVIQLVIPATLIVVAMLMPQLSHLFQVPTNVTSLEMNLLKLYGPNTETFYYGQPTYLRGFSTVNTNQNKAKFSLISENLILSENLVNDWILTNIGDNIELYIRKHLYGLEIQSNHSVTIWVNFEQYHSLPLAMINLFESVLNQLLQPNQSNIGVRIDSFVTSGDIQQLELISHLLPWFLSCLVFVPLAFPFLVASYSLLIIDERIQKVKLLQLMTGLSPINYWTANLAFDLMVHLIASSVLYLVIYLFDSDQIFFGKDTASNIASVLFVLLLSFGIAIIPLVYLLSGLFAKPSTGFVALLSVSFLVGFTLNIVFSVLDLLVHNFHYPLLSTSLYNLLIFLLDLFPLFSLLFGYQKLYKISSLGNTCSRLNQSTVLTNLCPILANAPEDSHQFYNFFRSCCENICNNYCSFETNAFAFGQTGVGQEVIAMIVCGVFCFLILVLREYYPQMLSIIFLYFRETKSKTTKNQTSTLELTTNVQKLDSAQDESNIIDSSNETANSLTISNLSKCFRSLTAVDNVSFKVHQNECFGLLGVNGAGKTTIFSLLTGDLSPSTGTAFIFSSNGILIDLCHNRRLFVRHLGYCPQSDAMWPSLTGTEIMHHFGRLRGIPSSVLIESIQTLVRLVGIDPATMHRPTVTYSGGNRRKLSLAVALLGTPSVLLLDEPSTGVDPSGRRRLWQTLSHMRQSLNCCIVLSSHSMPECEALCTRIGVLRKGQLQCVDTTQQLCHKFDDGFVITIKLNQEKPDLEQIQTQLSEVFADCSLIEHYHSVLRFRITDQSLSWSSVLRTMAQLDERFNFEDYNVSGTTLEQVFLRLATNH